MKDVLADMERMGRGGRPVALARVVGLEGSGPRDPGATMVVSAEGEVAGSVSGGCVEGAVLTEALEVLQGNLTPKLSTFGYSDDDAFAVGLSCGGTIHVFIEPLDPLVLDQLRPALASGSPIALATVVSGPDIGSHLIVAPGRPAVGTLGNPDLDRVVERDTLGELEAGRSGTRHYGPAGEARQDDVAVFIESFAPPPRMVIFGAVDFTAALLRVAKFLGYHVTVCDARAVFATKQRFPLADEVVVDWPDRYLRSAGGGLGPRDAVCVLTHDAKFDVPAIQAALATGVGYIGAMGSRRTHSARVDRLLEAGVSSAELGRVMSPIGLDLGSRTPEETAISICAEIIAQRTGREAPSLRDVEGPIHPARHA
jgi:xanthine dehydrogenase accessory factor